MKQLRNEFKAGIFILVALLLFVSSIFVMGREKQLFSDQIEYKTFYKDVKGLATGAAIRLGGITIGRVSDINFSATSDQKPIEVKFLINEKFTYRIHEDSTIEITTQGLLGDKFLNIYSGQSPNVLKAGSEVTSTSESDVSEIFSSAKVLVDRIDHATAQLDDALNKFNSETLTNFNSLIGNVNELTLDIKNKKGILHTLIYSESFGNETETLFKTVNTFLGAINNGNTDSGKLLKTAKETFENFKNISEEIKSGKGFVNSLIYSKDTKLNETLQKMSTIVNEIQKITNSISSGTGTFGALLIDSSLYDNLVDITDGAKKSFILKNVVRSSLK